MKKLLLFTAFLLTTMIGFSQAGDICFVHSATAGNISGNATLIDHPALNGNSSAVFFVTHSLNGDGSVTYNNKISGVFYDGSQWMIYNEDSSSMLVSSSYNVYVPGTNAKTVTGVSPGGTWYFAIDNPNTNNKPNLHPVITHEFATYLDHNFGVYYTGTDKWGIYSEDESTEIPSGATFFMLAEPSTTGYNTDVSFMHTATVANQGASNSTLIDHPLLNNNPDATFVLSHKWGVSGDHVYGTYYSPSDDKWSIYSEDVTAINSDEVFNIVISLPAPTNDLCIDATPLTVGVNFNDNDIQGTLLGSDGNYYGGVWYSVTVPGSGDLTIETDQASGSPMHDTWMAANSGSCGSLTFITADDNGGNGNFSKIVLSGLTPGETLYILIEEDADSSDPSDRFMISAYDISLSIADEIISGFNMYPNPVENILNLSAEKNIDVISVYNMLGEKVLQSTPIATQVAIDMTSLSTGAYVVKVQAGNQIGSYNLMKQ